MNSGSPHRRVAILVAAALVVAFAVPPRAKPAGPPELLAAASFPAVPWTAGAAEEPLPVTAGAALAGYGPLRHATGVRDPPMARAIALGPLAIVALDLIEVSPAFVAEVRTEAGGGPILVAATHTHSGPGGTDPNLLAQALGEGIFSRERFHAIAAAAAETVRRARAAARPARIETAFADRPDLQRERDRGGRPDPRLAALRALDEAGRPIATLAVLGAHPTVLPSSDRRLSADWPGAAVRALERRGEGVAVVLQGAGGDVSVPWDGLPPEPEARLSAFGENVAGAVAALLGRAAPLPPGPAGFSQAETPLPSLDLGPLLGPLRGIPERLLAGLAPSRATVAAASLGSLRILCVPGELTGAARRVLRLPGETFVVSLCGGDVSYIEAEEPWRARTGEKLALFGPQLAAVVGRAADVALAALPR